ncbi:MAG: arginase family protein [Pseudomonadota bacterium]
MVRQTDQTAMDAMTPTKTIRLLMPQWQGGNQPDYGLGAQLLAWLAPDSDDPLIEVPIDPPGPLPLVLEDGIAGRAVLLRQMRAARAIIDALAPDRIVVFGGDCLVDQAPFAYLSQKYGPSFGVLWIDAHPDVATPADRPHGHTMVLGSLLGQGDAEFAAEVAVPVAADRVMLAGLGRLSAQEAAFIARHGIRQASPAELALGTAPVRDWIADAGIRHLAIHLDLDVLDPAVFRATGFARPQVDATGLRCGAMGFAELVALIADVSQATTVVGLGITEHLPWEAINLKAMLRQFPILTGEA